MSDEERFELMGCLVIVDNDDWILSILSGYETNPDAEM